MSQNKYKCSGRDVKKNEQQQREKNPNKDVELCLEVEMDDEVRDIITSPEKCTSTLLDVTVIKPKDIDRLYCSQKTTLSGDEVKKLIASMELEKQDKQKLIDKILCSDDPTSSGDYVKKKYVKRISAQPVDKQRTSTTDDTNSDVVFSRKHKPTKKNDDRIQQIYTTPKTYNDIKSIFTCKNRNKYENDDKPDKPCLCRNCAVVGVLTDSQKKPFITENLYDPRDLISNSRRDSKDYKKKKYVNFKDEDHIECEYYFKHLSAKIRRLEERLAIQEEKAVPRDYFKRIITKLVTHLSKITNYSTYDGLYSRPKSKESKERFKMKDKFVDNRYYVHPVLIDPKPGRGDAEFVDLLDHDKDQQADGFWKWGEEILKPGIDLKNKIVTLLEDTLHSLKARSVPSKLGRTDKIVGSTFEPPQKIPAEVPVRDVPAKKMAATCQCKNCPNVNKNSSGSTLLKGKKSREKRGNRLHSRVKQESVNGDLLNVSYLNPQMWKWQEESQVSFKMDSSDMDSMRHSEQRRANENCKYVGL